MRAPRIVVVGDVVTDVAAHLAGPPVPGSDRSASVVVGGGGAGGNVAAWLAVTDADVHLVARVGDDDRGRSEVATLERLGVTCHVAVDPHRSTGTVVVLVDPDGERTMLPDRGANLALTPADVPADLLGADTHLHLSGYPLLDPASRDAALGVLARARGAGMTVSVDPSSTGPLIAVGVETFLRWTGGVTWCRANRDEARVLTGAANPEAATLTLAAHYPEAVVTSGADGAWWSDGTTIAHVDALAVAVRDTTGAGDAFTAGWLRARLDGAVPEVALAAGVALATDAVARRGPRPAAIVPPPGGSRRGAAPEGGVATRAAGTGPAPRQDGLDDRTRGRPTPWTT